MKIRAKIICVLHLPTHFSAFLEIPRQIDIILLVAALLF